MTFGRRPSMWGKVVDPAPGQYPPPWERIERPGWGGVWGPATDPAPPYELLDRARVARLRIRQIEMEVAQIQNYLDLLNQEAELLKEEYELE